jgi:adenylosuccinate synthase
MDKIPVCTHYLLDGKQTDEFPFPAALPDAKPVFEYLDGWRTDVSACRRFADLPLSAQRYVEFIEERIGCHIGYVSVGPERDSIIIR